MSFDPTKYTKSKWLKGADLPPGKPVTVTIQRPYEHTFEQSGETKVALDFFDLEQSLTLNKTQTRAVIDLFGNKPEEWIGKKIQLMAVPSSFQGKPTILITAAPRSNNDTNGNGNSALQDDAIADVQFQ